MMNMDQEARHRLIDLGNFTVRCACSATLGYVLAVALHLSNPVWASISALIVSQENIHATRSAISGRVGGTLLGALIALLVYRVGGAAGLPQVAQIALATGVCAVLAKDRPAIRVCLWTCPLVLLTTSSSVSPELTAVSRTAEVLVGVLVGGALHLLEASVMTWLQAGRYRKVEEQPLLPARLARAHRRGVLLHQARLRRQYSQFMRHARQ